MKRIAFERTGIEQNVKLLQKEQIGMKLQFLKDLKLYQQYWRACSCIGMTRTAISKKRVSLAPWQQVFLLKIKIHL